MDFCFVLMEWSVCRERIPHSRRVVVEPLWTCLFVLVRGTSVVGSVQTQRRAYVATGESLNRNALTEEDICRQGCRSVSSPGPPHPTSAFLHEWSAWWWPQKIRHYYFSLQLTCAFKTRKIIQKIVKTPQFWTERRGSSPKLRIKMQKKYKTRDWIKSLQLPSAKQQEKWQTALIFTDNFSGLEKTSKPTKVLLGSGSNRLQSGLKLVDLFSHCANG